MKTMLFLLVLLCAITATYSQVRKDQPAPEISLSNMEGNIVHLSDLKGKVVLIDFWASWCGPCRGNNPRLVKLYQKFHDKGFEILGISVDNNAMNWKEAVRQDQLEWLQVNDNKVGKASVSVVYDVNAIPASFLIDKNGIVRAKDIEGRALEAKIKSLLKK